MTPAGQTQNPVQPMPQDPAQAQQAPEAPRAPAKPLPRAKRGLRGIWANPEKYDTSDWNVYYFYFRQIAQHGGLKLKNLKWVGLIADIYFFIIILVVLFIKIKTAHTHTHVSGIDDVAKALLSLIVSGSIVFNPLGILFIILTVAPVVVVGRAFKLQTRNHGFLTSRAKEPPLLSHLVEYTSGNGLIEGVIQSFIYTYVRMFLFLLPAILLFVVTGIVAVTMLPTELGIPLLTASFLRISLGIIMGSLAAAVFLTMQGFSYRLDTLCFVVLLAAEFIFHYVSLAKYLLSSNSFDIGRSFLFLFLMWAACMVYFPLAAADTLEFGIGKHARTIRLFLLGIILVNILSLFFRIHFFGSISALSGSANPLSISSTIPVDLEHVPSGDIPLGISLRFTAMPVLWILAGVIGLLVSSLSAASYRAKYLFQLHMLTAKKGLLVRFFDPASPSSVIPVVALELFVAGLFAAITRNPEDASFWSGDGSVFPRTTLMIAFWIWSSFHFALMLVIFRRRHSHKERKPWLTHPQFSGTFFLILAILGIPWLLSGGNIVFPFFYLIMSTVSLFIIWEPVNESGDIHVGKELTADFGRDPQ